MIAIIRSSAARFQSVDGLPIPHAAGPWGSLSRPIPVNVSRSRNGQDDKRSRYDH